MNEPVSAPSVTATSLRNPAPSAFSRVWNKLSRIQPGWLPDVPDDEKRARFARVALSVLQFPLLVNFIGWYALVWAAGVLVNEFYVNPTVSRHFVTPHAPHDLKRMNRNWALLIVWGSVVFSWGWAYAWLTSGTSVSFLAPLWLGTACVHGLTYFSNQRGQFAACVGAPAVTCVLVPLTFSNDGLPAWCVLLGVGQFLFTAFLAFRDRHFLIRTLIRSRGEIRAANQANLSKSQFLATMSHELRTPLNAVIGYAEILNEDLNARGLEQGADDAARITRAARHLLDMINEILDLSKIEAGKLDLVASSTDIPSLLRDVAEGTAHLARDNKNDFSMEIAPIVGRIMVDSKRLRQCVLNLVSNACKFTENGRVKLRAWIDADGNLRIDVEDTGSGIAPDVAERLFQPFVQADTSTTRKHEGTGLGLVITRRLAQMMGGDVSFVSEFGKGSTFSLWVPAKRAAEPQAAAVAA